ncbi:LysR family transcriptional regulator [Methylovirgula sp. 4M-Z18]|uniref:LysR family transcriptional regulator n=1 Tax=Methylovirgula sp. 4M-Z18 TaxID=2293567 RepID=UPI000E2EB3D1|nr:LysR family transcriptional regulator [Methylovirgula sp. 4M-Z18]RFB79627.1 LysR family transcriptional regulator [Methylovirgula sp. 4M-Z18]
MQFRHLKTFVAVATTLNFTRAAARVHLAQSSLTEQIQALESDLGTALFDRSRRDLKLTEAGRRLLDYATDILHLADEARAAIASTTGALQGRLVIGALETLCAERLPAVLARFRQDHSQVDLVLQSAESARLRDGLKSGLFDVCFVFGDLKSDSELRHEIVAQEEIAFIAPLNNPRASQPVLTYEDLLDEAFLVTAPGCVYRRLFDEAFAAHLPARPKIAGEVGSINAIRSLVRAGAGSALVPHMALSENVDDMIVRQWPDGARQAPVTMAWRRRRVQVPALRSFLAAARDAFARSNADRHPHAARSP